MRKYLQMIRVLICFHAKTKDLLENIHEWPAKRKKHECFFCANFPLYIIKIFHTGPQVTVQTHGLQWLQYKQ